MSTRPGFSWIAALLALPCLLSACSTAGKHPEGSTSGGGNATSTGSFSGPPLTAPDENVANQGLASWYGQKFQGKRTASGERFDRHQLTAAHRTLAFGTLVKVTNLGNGKSVVVRINDRGPHSPSRLIDISSAAAHELGMMGSGLAQVRLEVLRTAGHPAP